MNSYRYLQGNADFVLCYGKTLFNHRQYAEALPVLENACINLEVEPVQKKEFYPYIEKVHNVVECNCVTGDYSMLIEGLFVSTIELDQFIGELQHFGRTRTQIVFSTSVEHRQVTAHEAEE